MARTDHCSLKYLLEQRITTAPQQKWISKLLGFDFHVEYKPGRSNTGADALSRRDEEVLASLCAISIPQLAWIAELKIELSSRQDMQPLIKKIQEGEAIGPWEFRDEVVWYKSKLFIPKDSTLAANIIAFVHNSCHEGYQKTMFRISREFYWQGMRSHIKEFVATCLICQRNKVETLKPAGLLQPLPIPQHVWTDVSMDFIEGLPSSQGKNVILVVVDRFSKYAHFVALSHPYTAPIVAHLFFENIVKLHGLPESIVCDRDVTFTSTFWKELFRLSGTKLCFSSAYHPQSDGQTEAVNRVVEMYLRCFSGDLPKKWLSWLAWAEFCYNTGFHSSLRATPFEVVYGCFFSDCDC